MKRIEDLERVPSYTKDGIVQAAKQGHTTKFADFASVFYQFFNSPCEACFDCPSGFNNSFDIAQKYYQKYLTNPNILMENSTIKILGGGVINSKWGTFTPNDITDEIALKLIKTEPNMKGSFEPSTLPKDLDKQLETVTTFEEDAKAAQLAAQKPVKEKKAEAETTATTEDAPKKGKGK